MKANRDSGQPSKKLINLMFRRTLLLLIVAVLTVAVLRSMVQGYVGNMITHIICVLGRMDWDRAVYLYDVYVRSNLNVIIVVAIVIFFVILFRIFLSGFSRYFNQITAGINQLAEEREDKIELAPELNFVADKLNQVQDELKRRAKAEQEAEQRKNDLVVYLAHDIKTPLTSVIGYLTLLSEATDLSEEQREKYIYITLQKAYRLEKLINEFFEVTRYHLQSTPLHLESIDLYYMMVQIADEAYPQLMESGKQVNIDMDESLMLTGDPDQLARVFNNLLKNAIAYSAPGSTICINGARTGQSVTIRFQNPGAIPRDQLTHIFEKFCRLDGARSTETGGAGLGLAIARDIVTLHGGTIRADSDGTSTTFTVCLPQRPCPAAKSSEQSHGNTI